MLTDECLQYCDKDVFAELNDSLIHNRQSALTLLDFSRNFHAFSDSVPIHEAFIKALKNQKSKPQGLKIETNSKVRVESVRFSSQSEKIRLLYTKAIEKDLKHIEVKINSELIEIEK